MKNTDALRVACQMKPWNILDILRVHHSMWSNCLAKRRRRGPSYTRIMPFPFSAGIQLSMDSANESRLYCVTSSLIDWAHNQYDPLQCNNPCYAAQK